MRTPLLVLFLHYLSSITCTSVKQSRCFAKRSYKRIFLLFLIFWGLAHKESSLSAIASPSNLFLSNVQKKKKAKGPSHSHDLALSIRSVVPCPVVYIWARAVESDLASPQWERLVISGLILRGSEHYSKRVWQWREAEHAWNCGFSSIYSPYPFSSSTAVSDRRNRGSISCCRLSHVSWSSILL